MNVLVACEFSGIVRSAFADLGHNAWSCDLLPTELPGSHYQGDVRELLAQNLFQWDLIIGHPACFTEDTLVLTRTGYKNICDILVGEQVLTHKGRWRKVTAISDTLSRNLLDLKITGAGPIRCTTDHPFYTRTRKWKSVRTDSGATTIFHDGKPYWKQAGELSKLDLIGSTLPPVKRVDLDDELLWLMGRYVADGYYRLRNGRYEEVQFSIGKHKVDYFRSKVSRKFSVREVRTAALISMYNQDFVKQFAQFGKGAKNKTLPGWVLTLPEDQAKVFLDGYLSGDGHYGDYTISAVSVSKKLIYGVSVLFRRVFKRGVNITFSQRGPTTVIEGRVVNQSNTWSCHSSSKDLADFKKHLTVIDGDRSWYHYRKSERVDGLYRVYNLSVEEDESYIVNNVLVHNCTFLTNSGVRWLYEKDDSPEERARVKKRWGSLEQAREFFMFLYEQPAPYICIENPIPHSHAQLPPYTQTVQPWQYGDFETKRTCLWLRNLPPLKPLNPTLDDARAYHNLAPDAKPAAKVHLMSPGPNRAKERSRFFPGIARAMAQQWTDFIDGDA